MNPNERFSGMKGRMMKLASFGALLVSPSSYAYVDINEKMGCTAILVGPKATTDGSLITTHNADCLDCDFRIARTPAMTHAPGSSKPSFKYTVSAHVDKVVVASRLICVRCCVFVRVATLTG